jgi:two-component system nitrate/nitrite sensor histidine kinase NarX
VQEGRGEAGFLRLNSIQGRLGLLFLAFVLLVTISVFATFRGLNVQKTDALVINLAGRQRMLVQLMTRLGVELDGRYGEANVSLLNDTALMFDETLSAFQNGGSAPYLPGQRVEIPASGSSEIQQELGELRQLWDPYKSTLDNAVLSSQTGAGDPAAFDKIREQSQGLVQQADTVVRLYETQSTQRVIRLRSLQIVFFVLALMLLLSGVWVTRNFVLQPLGYLGEAAQRIGKGDLSVPVKIDKPDEFRILASTIQDTQTELDAARKELLSWTENLERRVTQRTRELETLNVVTQEVTSKLNLRQVLSLVTERSCELLDAEVAFVCLLDGCGEKLWLHSASGPEKAVLQTNASVNSGWTSSVLESDGSIRCEADGCRGFCEILDTTYRVSHLAAPLIAGERVIGALCVGGAQAGKFNDEDDKLLSRLANVAALALENARLYQQADRAAILEERQRIASDIHDGLIQTINYMRIKLENLDRQVDHELHGQFPTTLNDLQVAMDQAEDEARRAFISLQEDFPVTTTLQECFAEIIQEENGGDVDIVWESKYHSPVVLPRQEMEQVLRVMREALSNARRHSSASRIIISLEKGNGQISMRVEDNGEGFILGSLPDDGRQHFGLKIMQARAARLRGSLKIDSVPGEGTRVELTWPPGEIDRTRN